MPPQHSPPRPSIDGNPDHVYIREAAELLNRRMATLRKWDLEDTLPIELRPHRGARNMRYWTHEQIDGIKEWIRNTNRYTGNGLPHYNPTEKDIDNAMEAMRAKRPRKNRLEELDLGE